MTTTGCWPIWIRQFASSRTRLASIRCGGFVLVGNGELDRAIGDCDKAIQLNGADAAAHVTRGNVWMARKDYRRAHADFDEAIRLARPTRITGASVLLAGAWRVETAKQLTTLRRPFVCPPTMAVFSWGAALCGCEGGNMTRPSPTLTRQSKSIRVSRGLRVPAPLPGNRTRPREQAADLSQAIKRCSGRWRQPTGARVARANSGNLPRRLDPRRQTIHR